MSNPPRTGLATPHPRQRHPTTNHGPAATRSAHISLTARRAQHRRTATHPADHTPTATPAQTRQLNLHELTNRRPYQLTGDVSIDAVAALVGTSTFGAPACISRPGPAPPGTHSPRRTIFVTEGIGLCQREPGLVKESRPGRRVV